MQLVLKRLPADGNEAVCVDKSNFLVGRAPTADLVLHSELVSRYHAQILQNGDGGVVVRDLDSRNGTYVNGQPVDKEMELFDGDVVSFGIVSFNVQIEHGLSGILRSLKRRAGLDSPFTSKLE